MTATGGESTPGFASASCRVRSVLDRIGDKWAIYVVDRLGSGPRRFSELLRGIDGITARMLTVTLRGLERDGILTRTVHATVPARVVLGRCAIERAMLAKLAVRSVITLDRTSALDLLGGSLGLRMSLGGVVLYTL